MLNFSYLYGLLGLLGLLGPLGLLGLLGLSGLLGLLSHRTERLIENTNSISPSKRQNWKFSVGGRKFGKNNVLKFSIFLVIWVF